MEHNEGNSTVFSFDIMFIVFVIFFTTLFIFLIVLAIIFIYNKLTCGINKCSRRLLGKVVIVTGANRGIGYETAKDMAERGARVILGCRDESRGIAARDSIISSTDNKDVHYQRLDLESLDSVRAFADTMLKNEKTLDILINNAGILKTEHNITEDGLLQQMEINHFGPFLLTNLLLPLLKSSAPSRIINVSSVAHKRGKIDFENLNMEKENKNSYKFMKTYCNSKLCNILMTLELSRQLKGTGVTANSLHPGVVETEIIQIKDPWFNKYILPILGKSMKTPWEGAQTTIYLAVSPEVNEMSGLYFSDCRAQSPSKLAQDTQLARKLWEVSAKLVNLK